MGTIASQTVKGLVLGLLLGAMVWQGGFEEPQAQAQHLTPYHHTGFVAGVPVGYGWYSWWSFPVVVPYGYSY